MRGYGCSTYFGNHFDCRVCEINGGEEIKLNLCYDGVIDLNKHETIEEPWLILIYTIL